MENYHVRFCSGGGSGDALAYRNRPEMTGPHLAELSQGRWRDVLQAWLAAKQISSEAFQYERAYLKAIGERYDPEAVRNAARQAEACFAEALRRQPDSSIALVNWGAIKAERALFFSIENGVIDQARLQGAQALFNRAQGQLEQRRDRDGQIALGLCLYHDATRLPPDANLGAVEWATQRAQQMRREFPQAADQGAIQWEMVQRNWARRDARFFDEQKARRAKQLLVAAGAAALIALLDEKLTAHAEMAQQATRWGKAAGSITRRVFLLRAGIGAGAVVVAGGAAIAGATIISNRSATTTTPTARPPTFTTTRPPAPGDVVATHTHRDSVTSLSWSPGGSASARGALSRAPGAAGLRIASACQDGTVDVWDAASGKTLRTYTGHTAPVLAVAWSPDGSLVASAGLDRLVHIWDPTSGERLSVYEGHDGMVYSLAWSPDSQLLASGGDQGFIQVTDTTSTPRPGPKRVGFHEILALAWSPNQQYLIGGGGYIPVGLTGNGADGALSAHAAVDAGLVAVWDVTNGAPLALYRNHPTTVLSVACSPNSTTIVSGSDNAQVWDIASGKPLFPYNNHNGRINALGWSSDGGRIASGSADETVQVWDASSGSTLFTYTKHRAAVNTVGWAPDGKYIASGSADRTVQVWVAP